ncbi:alpha/beta fold hydrolase [Herbiconiux ginsengi]|uniref:Pimeloyl-ACP methyl ester carboxylesterase n=1 Tax=Herbiconiux ginsengi TaxID=381665 RepID=A0A1H3LTM6_9MICO|nr:alpha/beta hydrolase [Herbiconiux ginsengi]SDY67751.1 Pimeloyl-ACP methyl ester carboxylesterase [Herbiconiux ginsengi]
MDTLIEHAVRVETRLGRLHLRITGTGRLTVLWPSMFVDSHTWNRILPLLAASSTVPRRFVLVDPPGLGLSDPLRRRSSIAEATDAARELLAHLGAAGTASSRTGTDTDLRADWVGNAFGGHVGFGLATDDSGLIRSLVAISSPVEAISPALRRQIQLLKPLLRLAGPIGPVRDAVLGAMLTDASAATPGMRSTVLESLQRPGKASMSLALRSFILDRTDVTEQLVRIRVPSLFVASDDRGDWSPADAERSAALTPGAEVLTIEGARTLVPLEQPEALAASILAFWKAQG